MVRYGRKKRALGASLKERGSATRSSVRHSATLGSESKHRVIPRFCGSQSHAPMLPANHHSKHHRRAKFATSAKDRMELSQIKPIPTYSDLFRPIPTKINNLFLFFSESRMT